MACTKCGVRFIPTPIPQKFNIYASPLHTYTQIGAKSFIQLETPTKVYILRPGETLTLDTAYASNLVEQGAPIWVKSF